MADKSKKKPPVVVLTPGLVMIILILLSYLVLSSYIVARYAFEPSVRTSSVRKSTTQPVPFDAERREQVRDFVADEIDRQTGRSLHLFNDLASTAITVCSILIAVALAIFGFSWWRQTREHKDIIDKAEDYRMKIKDTADKVAEDEKSSKEHLEQIKKYREQIEKELEETKRLRKSAEEAARSSEASSRFAQALTYQNEGELDKAIEEYGKSIAAKETPWAYNNRGGVWTVKGEFDNAIADYNKAIGLDPKYAAAYNNRGVVWVDKGEFDKAIADFDKAIELDPKDADFYPNVAEALITLKRDFRGAVERIEQGRGHNAFESNRDRLIARCLEGIALALNSDDASAAEAEAKRLLAGGTKAGKWDTEPIERFLKDLKPKDFASGALETARRINDMLKI